MARGYIPVYTHAVTFLQRVCSALSQAKVRHAVVGGHAVALHGAVRGTLDVDIAVHWTRSALRKAERAMSSIGLISRLPVTADEVFDFRDEFIARRNLLAWNFYNPNDFSEAVDILLAYDLKGKRTRGMVIGGTEVRVLSIADLIVMKKASGRPQDLADVEALEKLR